MQELEKIVEEIDGMIESYKENPRLESVDICYGLNQAKRIIRKHMKTNETFEFDFSGVESFDCQCGRHYINTAINDGWIPADERLPEEGEKVLVWYEYFRYGEYNRMYETYGISWQYDGHWSGDVSGTKAKCIAWQPLPEPYLPADKMEKPDWMKDMLKKFDRRE